MIDRGGTPTEMETAIRALEPGTLVLIGYYEEDDNGAPTTALALRETPAVARAIMEDTREQMLMVNLLEYAGVGLVVFLMRFGHLYYQCPLDAYNGGADLLELLLAQRELPLFLYTEEGEVGATSLSLSASTRMTLRTIQGRIRKLPPWTATAFEEAYSALLRRWPTARALYDRYAPPTS